ncbi:hypothetical protein [Niabella drilacis]|uniref:Adhesin domain-containing protein n=1 Tax=Niabella drilacis (strain DSM 25811 / CCM 8410 / CCUG 62505 / LMG 26954 / E90) TaxID=1285928 RepID=A0A1G7AW88_NIADE|nr:hypothetical protein [Niabella drilacis]SDE18982.1 hypothetical protein SAMN04487894_12542 [Niabella drilacis]
MKHHIKIFSLLLLLLAVSNARAYNDSDEWNAEKRKTISRSYPLTDRSRVSIKNSFGNVTVVNWNKNEVKVEVTITVKANSDEAASAILDGIHIEESSGTDVSFETKIRSRNNTGRGKSSSMQINYVVTLPSTANLRVTNSFGNTTIPDRSGATELSQSYGDLTTGTLANTERLSVDFGKLIARELENTKVHVKFSKVEIGKLSGNFDGNFQFCTKPSISFTPAIRNVKIETKYSDLTISFPKPFDANIDIITNFGKVMNNSDLKLTDKDGGRLTEMKYTAPSSRTDRKISIRSEFGKIQLR